MFGVHQQEQPNYEVFSNVYPACDCTGRFCVFVKPFFFFPIDKYGLSKMLAALNVKMNYNSTSVYLF